MKHQRIIVNPGVMTGKPCIADTRIPVEQILRELAGGMTPAEILEAHPRLTAPDIAAAIDYAADVLRQVWMVTQPALLGEIDHAISG
jgi:uncharacterized protein (DUF433 family)